MGRKYGFSFSWKRATGISGLKGRISRKIGIPLTRSGRQRKIGRIVTGGRCFVATACYGNAEHPDVVALRRFRDSVLRRSGAGRRFIGWYYRYGPIFARFLVVLPGLRLVVRPVITALAGALRRPTLHGR